MLQRQAGGVLRLLGLPLSFDGTRPAFDKAAPKLGEDNSSVLGRS
jgi:crotonobetainyl-CoA:carnitine CoA-transferase CaiB-like acyl-CoA transferase